MANLICILYGVRGRNIEIFDNKCIIHTELTAGSLLSGNTTDGEKTLFYMDCVGVQFKESKATIGYLQLETPSMQMNNQSSNFFSENTFTFEQGKNGLSNPIMRQVYRFICERVEGYKYGTNTQPLTEAPDYLKDALAGVPGALPTPVLPPPAFHGAPHKAAPEGWVCRNCGNKNRGSSAFCVECGTGRA